MTHTAADIARFHAALHRLCGMAALAPTLNDQRTWHDFLLEMRPLEDTDGGPFTLADITAVLSQMARQNRQGGKWSMRPSTILRDPEKFRDMILQERSSFRVAARTAARPAPRPAIQNLPTGTRRITEDPTPDPEAVSAGAASAAAFAALRKQAGL